jgi:hypothetical protein
MSSPLSSCPPRWQGHPEPRPRTSRREARRQRCYATIRWLSQVLPVWGHLDHLARSWTTMLLGEWTIRVAHVDATGGRCPCPRTRSHRTCRPCPPSAARCRPAGVGGRVYAVRRSVVLGRPPDADADAGTPAPCFSARPDHRTWSGCHGSVADRSAHADGSGRRTAPPICAGRSATPKLHSWSSAAWRTGTGTSCPSTGNPVRPTDPDIRMIVSASPGRAAASAHGWLPGQATVSGVGWRTP